MSTQDTMLNIARRAILDRATLDGYAAEDYDPAEDPEGYVISLLIGLRHWCHTNGIDWQGELSRAQELFEEDLHENADDEPESSCNNEVCEEAATIDNDDSLQIDRTVCTQDAVHETAGKIFDIVCDSDWPEQPDAWPEDAILRALEELRQQQNLQEHANVSASDHS